MMTHEDAAIVKGMLIRGDKQQWIVAWFGGELNPGRIADISTGKTFTDVSPAPPRHLPPVGPYVSGQKAHRALLALSRAKVAIDEAFFELSKVETVDD